MKRCPECGREYDNTMMFCLDDGAELLYGPASADEPATAILSERDGDVTRPQVHTTDQTAIFFRREAEPQGGLGSSERQSLSAHRAAEPKEHRAAEPKEHRAAEPKEHRAAEPKEHRAAEPKEHRAAELKEQPQSKSLSAHGTAKPLIAAMLAVATLVGGFFGYRYFNAAGNDQINSIAVLPFENRSSDADSEYLSDGIAESLIYRLSQIPDLKVSSRSSVFRYKGKAIDPEQIGSELGVDAVMSGRMVQRGDNLTISVDLVDVRNKKTLWGEQFERKMSDLLATQREIASAITDKLQLKLSGEAAKGITKRYTDNNEAYQAYLKGRYYWNRRTAINLKKALDEFKTATEKDPNFALAFVGLADCYTLMGEYAGAPTSETLPKARANAERALALDSELGEVHATIALIADYGWQWEEAERGYKRAIEANPNYPTTYHWYSITLKALGRFDEAHAMIKRAQELDPVSSIIAINITRMLQIQKNDEAAIQSTLKLIELDPTFPAAYQYIALSYARQGKIPEAIAAGEKAVEMSNRSGISLGDLGFVYATAGRREEARSIIKELELKHGRGEAKALFLGVVYAGLGEKDKMFEWLEKDFAAKNGQLAEIRWQMPFDPFRDDPRYKDLLKRMGLPE